MSTQTDMRLINLQEQVLLARQHHSDAKEAWDKSNFDYTDAKVAISLARHNNTPEPGSDEFRQLESNLALAANRFNGAYADFVVTQKELHEAEEALKEYENSPDCQQED